MLAEGVENALAGALIAGGGHPVAALGRGCGADGDDVDLSMQLAVGSKLTALGTGPQRALTRSPKDARPLVRRAVMVVDDDEWQVGAW